MNKPTVSALIAVAVGAGVLGAFVGRGFAGKPHVAERQVAADRAPISLQLSQARISASGIDVVAAQSRSLQPDVISQAVIAASPRGEAIVAARTDGAVIRLLKRLGDEVRAGETVGLIESRDAASIAADRAKAAAQATAARAKYAREKRLFEAGVTARQDYEAAQEELAIAQAEAARTTATASAAGLARDGRAIAVVSPTAGKISAAPVQLGAFVTAGAEIYRVVNPAEVEIQASVPGADVELIRVGAKAVVESDQPTAAIVSSISPALDPVSRTATIILKLVGDPGRLQPGQAVRVRISASGARSPTPTVPSDAIQLLNGQDVVFVRTTQGFRVQPVTLGARTDAYVEIRTGLKPGQQVAGRNAFLLKAELEKPSEEGDAK